MAEFVRRPQYMPLSTTGVILGKERKCSVLPDDNVGIITLSNNLQMEAFLLEEVKFRIANEILGLKKKKGTTGNFTSTRERPKLLCTKSDMEKGTMIM